ncbi:hypothetical protein D9758_007798 [Tetrapyrgos nigripes]|uniref:Uncharacterized protein n=1 Tax=Tetrapyrgos nigripes TaxID=182062 RepID=A0A8H5FVG2_9AGAR|nr:hypothetical protein D9758_007798 [Tetrapyrgos nigripes]
MNKLAEQFFATLCSDETFWKRKLQDDFNFSGAQTARTSGWKFIYQRLSKPRGGIEEEFSREPKDGRLGLSRRPQTTLRDVPYPIQLQIPNSRIVSLVAGGMSFHALDSEGQIHVWGTLDGTSHALTSDGFSESAKSTNTPLRLQLPSRTRSISCGRIHSSTMDSTNSIWTFMNWGRPFRLSTQRLSSNPDLIPIQVECGWMFSSVLTKSGDVFIWWPFSGRMETLVRDKMTSMDQEGDKQKATNDGVIPCVCWDLALDPYLLPPIPSLPDLSTSDDAKGYKHTQIMQIAGFDNHLIALTNHGHVLMFDSLANEGTAPQGSWQYLPNFSEANRVRVHPTFSKGKIAAPERMKITHISAHYLKFFAYSTGSNSVVLMGDVNSTPESAPTIIPALQNKSVISVVVGDYHYCALTATGKLLTWGAYSRGALGLGDPADIPVGTPGGFPTEEHRQRALDLNLGTPPEVQEPTAVRFDHHRKKPKDRFCIGAAAAGWHTGALVIDLEPNENDEDSDIEVELETSQPALGRGSGHRLPFINHAGGFGLGRGASVFRVGYAGRAMPRGRGL